jgi:hypothetical protein
MNKASMLGGVEGVLAYPFKGTNWRNRFVIGAALFLANYIVPIVPSLFVTGYFAKMLRTAILEEAEPTLPEWSDWGSLLKNGFKVWAATVIYLLPPFMLTFFGYLIAYVPLFVSMLASNSGSNTGDLGLGIICLLVGLPIMLIGFVLYIPLIFVLPAAIAHLVAKDSFAAAFHIREWWAILRANVWGYFTAVVVALGVYMALLLVSYIFYFSIILCALFPIALSVIFMYLSAVAAPLFGDAYRTGAQNLASQAGKSSH